MSLAQTLEKFVLRRWQLEQIEGDLRLDSKLAETFLSAPFDILPGFEGPTGSKLRGGRGKDHPRYGRFIYSLAKTYKPELVVEVGTYAGGTAIGWTLAFLENGRGKLVCVDNDTYSKNTYPVVTRRNLERIGIKSASVELKNGESKTLVPELAKSLKGKVDIYLVDGDHTFEGALADIRNGLPMVKPGGLILVHDVDRGRRMDEQTPEHPHPVYEAFHQVVTENNLKWCILKFIRKHLGVMQVS